MSTYSRLVKVDGEWIVWIPVPPPIVPQQREPVMRVRFGAASRVTCAGCTQAVHPSELVMTSSGPEQWRCLYCVEGRR